MCTWELKIAGREGSVVPGMVCRLCKGRQDSGQEWLSCHREQWQWGEEASEGSQTFRKRLVGREDIDKDPT